MDSTSDPSPPPGLKSLGPILKHAAQLRSQVPVMSYLCSLYAVQMGLKIKGTDPVNKAFLVGLIDRLEGLRTQLGPALDQVPDHKTFATNFAVKVFGHADDEYRAGLATRDTAKYVVTGCLGSGPSVRVVGVGICVICLPGQSATIQVLLGFLSCRNFYAAAVFFDVLRQFDDPLPDDIENMRKYAKYSAVQVTKAIKQGLPVVHPDMEGSSQEADDTFTKQPEGGYIDPFSAAAGFPTIGSLNDHSASMSTESSSTSHNVPAHTSPSFDVGGGIHPSQSYPSVPPAPHAQALGPPPSNDSIEQLLSLFPTVPASARAGSTTAGTGITSASGSSGSTSVGWPSVPPPSQPSQSAPFSSHHPASQTQAPSNVGHPDLSKPTQVTSSQPPAATPASASSASSASSSSSASASASGFVPSAEVVEKAQKVPHPMIPNKQMPISQKPLCHTQCARFAVSALQFEDLPYAVQNLKQALTLLTGNQYP